MSTYYENVTNYEGVEYETADQLVVAFIVKPNIIKRSRSIYCTVELSKGDTRGQMICDWTNHSKRAANVTVVTDIDMSAYKELLLGALL